MYVIGIDEAGRGSLAGPVVVAAVLTPKNFYPRGIALPKLRDSKKLSPIQRQVWFEYLKSHPKVLYATARVYPRKIENINIARAANLASTRALLRLSKNFNRSTKYRVLLDGSLYLIEKYLPTSAKGGKTIIRGDEKFVSIKLASIVAKVTRDNYMVKLNNRQPLYQFNIHKGYGTALHRALISKHGPAEVHRLTYLKKYHKLAAV